MCLSVIFVISKGVPMDDALFGAFVMGVSDFVKDLLDASRDLSLSIAYNHDIILSRICIGL